MTLGPVKAGEKPLVSFTEAGGLGVMWGVTGLIVWSEEAQDRTCEIPPTRNALRKDDLEVPVPVLSTGIKCVCGLLTISSVLTKNSVQQFFFYQ